MAVILRRPYRRSSLLDGLLSFWKLGDLNDSVGGRTLTNTNGVTFGGSSPGPLVPTASNYISASSQELSVSGTGLSIPAAGFTVAGWVKITSAAASKMIVSKDQTSNREWELFVVSNRTIRFTVFDSTSTARDCTSTDVISVDIWAFVIGIYDGADTLSVQINGGTPRTASLVNAPPFTASASLRIGSYGFAGAFMQGSIGSVGIWNRALSTREITALYNGGRGIQWPFYNAIC